MSSISSNKILFIHLLFVNKCGENFSAIDDLYLRVFVPNKVNKYELESV